MILRLFAVLFCALTLSAPASAPVIDTTLLPADGFGRPHTITGGF